MATVFLPLSSFSQKILLTEYAGADPITPGRADWLSDMLRVDRTDTRFPETVTTQMRAGLLLNVAPPLADRIATQGPRIGAVIHRHHVEQLTRYMLASSMGITNAKAAMQSFYEHYGIDDDDVSQESMYREFSRFRRTFFRQKLATTATKSRDRVPQKSQLWQGSAAPKNRISNTLLDDLCRHLDERLTSSRIRRTQRIREWAHIYIYSVRGGRNAEAIAAKFKKHRATVFRAMTYVRTRIRRDRRFAEAIMPLLDASFVLPEPAPAGHLCGETPGAVPA